MKSMEMLALCQAAIDEAFKVSDPGAGFVAHGSLNQQMTGCLRNDGVIGHVSFINNDGEIMTYAIKVELYTVDRPKS